MNDGGGIRLAELVSALSLATDLGLGQPMEHVQRSTRLALNLADSIGLGPPERDGLFFISLLTWIGCSADGYEPAALFGDDIAFRAGVYDFDLAGVPLKLFALSRAGSGQPIGRRLQTLASFMTTGPKQFALQILRHCETAATIASQLSLSETVTRPLVQIFERWDGRGAPARLRGEEIDVCMRIIHLTEIAEVYHRVGGIDAATGIARERRGGQFDPDLVDEFVGRAPDLLGSLDEASDWSTFVESEPALDRVLHGDELDQALTAVADFADLKSPYTIGHSRGVAALAYESARLYGLPESDAVVVRRAGLVHDLGRIGISNAIWDKRGALTVAELERVRLHPYLTERVLASTPPLADISAIAALHHERLDGSGYHRGLTGSAITTAGRILAAADVYHAMTEPRPHRPPRSPEEAERELRDEVRAGRLEGAAVNAVLTAAGHRVQRRPELPAGLTPREAEVLVHITRGLSNREVASQLSLAPKTVGNHVEHIYSKLGVRTRAGAALFAMQHGLVPG